MSIRIRFWNILMIAALVVGAVFVSPAQPVKAANDLRISQVYGGGGNAGALYTNDFIELFNAGASPVNLTGWSVQYASASGTSWTNKTSLSGTIQPGQYMLIQEASGGAVGSPLPTPDLSGSINMSGSNGKVALVNNTVTLPAEVCPTGIVDIVSYGDASSDCEGQSTSNTSVILAAIRNAQGCTDTDNNLADFTIATPNPRNSATPIHTCGADLAPSVASTTPTNNATGVALDADLTITFSEAVDVAADWVSISCATSGAHTAAISGGPTNFTLNPAADFVNSELCTVTVDATKVTDQDLLDPPDAMAANYVFSFSAVNAAACGLPYTAIHDIQGATDTPALSGVQTTEGVVTADYQSGGFNGFYLQAVPGTEDTNAATSEGVFVYNTSFPVNPGDHVRLTGSVSNYTGGGFSSMTQISTLTDLEVCTTAVSMTPVTVTLPEDADPATYLERYEGMLVSFPETLVVQQNYFQGRYGQLTLGDGRMFQMNNFSMGGNTEAPLSAVILDDGSTTQNRSPIPYLPADGAVRAGNTVTGGLTGVLDNGQINTSTSATSWPMSYYRLQPLEPASVTFDATVNARSVTPPVVGGSLKVVGANVLNYFTTLDDGSNPGPYGGGNTPRGADTATEFTRQQAKIVAMLAAMDADVYSLMEIESWDGAYGGLGAVQALVDALNAEVGAGTYAVVADPLQGAFDPADGGDFIQVALIYKTATVAPVGPALSSADTIFSRSPFAQEFEELASGEEFVVVANHLKSKGSCPSNPLDPNADQGDGQGCWNLLRSQQAAALLTFINTDLVPLDPDVLVLGDLNAYGAEDPVTVLTSGGLVNQVAANVPAAERYSYVFDGTAGYLDHALSTASFSNQLTDVAFWHINADEPSVIDYNTEFKTVDLYQPHMFRASDHDPVLVGLDLDEENVAPVAVNDSYSVAEDTTLTVAAPGVLANDTDTDPLTAAVVTPPTHGTLELNADGSFSYIPGLNYNGLDTFTYKANDGELDSAEATVTITITPVNDGPEAVDDAYTVMENGSLTVDAAAGVLANDVEVDGDNVAVSLVMATTHGTLSLRADGSFTYTPNPGFYGEDSFVYQLTTYPAPLAPWTDEAVVTITVTPLFHMWMPIITR